MSEKHIADVGKLDTISRQAAIDSLYCGICTQRLLDLPSAQPEEIALHESCTDCPLYDKDRHRCPRFNKVIPETLRELQSAQPEVVYCKKCKHWTRTCGDEQWGLGDCDVFDKHLVMCNGYCAWAERRQDEQTD